MKRNNHVPPAISPSGEADVAHDANQTPARHKSVEASSPDTFEAGQKVSIIFEPTYLPIVIGIFLQCPIRRGGHDKMDGRWRQFHPPGVARYDLVSGPHAREQIPYPRDGYRIFSECRNRALAQSSRIAFSSGVRTDSNPVVIRALPIPARVSRAGTLHMRHPRSRRLSGIHEQADTETAFTTPMGISAISCFPP